MMRPVVCAGITALVLAVADPATVQAELLVYEPFDYAERSNLDGLPATGFNLTGTYSNSTIQDLVISAPGSTYGSLSPPVAGVSGNRLGDRTGAGSDVVSIAIDQDVEIGEGEQIYFSGLFTLDDSNNANRFARISLLDDENGEELEFGEAVVGVRAIRVAANTAATGQLVSASEDLAFENGQTLWLIGRYVNSAAPAGDLLQLIGYDTAIAQPIASSFDVSDPNAHLAYTLSDLDINFTRLSAIRFEIRGTNDNFLDELRIGTTYGSVAVPEPTGISTLLTALFLLGVAARSGKLSKEGNPPQQTRPAAGLR